MSKLIANDAMELSLVISDALAEDTTTTPLEIVARGDLLAFQNKDELAKLTYYFLSTFPKQCFVQPNFV